MKEARNNYMNDYIYMIFRKGKTKELLSLSVGVMRWEKGIDYKEA